jgi:uroporphyrinogen-III synthase
MAYWTNAADALRNARHFAVGPAFAEFFKTAKFDDVKFGIGDIAFVVHEDTDLGVAFDAGYRINDNSF